MVAGRTTPAGRAVFKAAQEIVGAAGGRCWIENAPGTNGHQRLVIEIGQQRRFTVISGSPRNADQAVKHKRSDVRRIIRELGAN